MEKPSNNKNNNEGGCYQSPSSLHGQNKLLGIGLFLIAVFSISMTNICAKWASTNHHPIDILFYRNLGALIITAFWIKAKYGDFKILKTNRPFDHIRRGILGTISVGTAFGAFALLPATDATVILFTIPIFTAILSIIFLGEKVGITRWSVILTGFIGVYIAIDPSIFNSIDPSHKININGVILALTAAIASAITALYIRDLGKTEPSARTVFYFLLIGVIILLPIMPFVATAPTKPMLAILLLTGVLGFTNQILKTTAYGIAPVTLLSPFLYTMLIWAILFDIIIWHTMPSISVLIGASIIITSNLFLLWRENKNSKNV